MGGNTFHVKIGNLSIGLQGVAAKVWLSDELKQWYYMTNTVPHILVMVFSKARGLGPMMKIKKTG